MKEHPIIFSTDMVKAILEGRKTMTRRVIKPQPKTEGLAGVYPDLYNHGPQWAFWLPDKRMTEPRTWKCPYGQVGDRLWVRETHYRWGRWVKNGFTKTGRQKWTFKAANKDVRYCDNPPGLVLPNSQRDILGWFKRPSIFMPRWASRTTLETTELRVERLQEITEADAIAEGIKVIDNTADKIYSQPNYLDIHRDIFIGLWNKLNAKRGYGWDTNCWCWVIGFKVAKS